MDFLDSVVPVISGNNTITNAEKSLRPILIDDYVQVLSSFELNQVASLTYNDLTCDGIFELLERIFSKPLDYTPLTIQKSLVAMKHILIYGSEKTVNHAYGLLDFVKALLDFNTVLTTKKQGGAMSFFQTIKGGGVDKGGPVRDAAEQVVKLLSNINELQRIRNANASPDSLVPVGNDGVAFVSDDVRLHILKRKIKEEQEIRIKSNLKKSEGGWGAGYASQDGKSVVGAAHGIEEMIKMANKQTTKFSDDNNKPSGHKTEEQLILEELKAEADAAAAVTAATNKTGDLLGSFNPAPAAEVDLLDFGMSGSNNGRENSTMNARVDTGDLLGGASLANTGVSAVSNDPFGLTSAALQSTPTSGGLLDIMSVPAVPSPAAVDPFASISSEPNHPINENNESGTNNTTMNTDITSLSSEMTTMSLMGGAHSTPSHKAPMMTSNEDRFAALDSLAASTPAMVTALDAKNAENRLLNSMMGSPPTGSGTSCDESNSFSTPMGMPSVPTVPDNMVAPGSGQVAKAYGGSCDSDEDNPFVMGGSAGSGLVPIGPAPGSAPPPPPPI